MSIKKASKSIVKVCVETLYYTACGMTGAMLTLGIIGAIDKIRNR